MVAKQKKDSAKTPLKESSPPPPAARNSITTNNTPPAQDAIARCAYLIWERAGRPDGRALEHWMQAEAGLAALRPRTRYGLVVTRTLVAGLTVPPQGVAG